MRIHRAVLSATFVCFPLWIGPSAEQSIWNSGMVSASIPQCPTGSEIKVYGPLHLNSISQSADKTADWRPYFRKLGVEFPKGGFAIFIPKAKCLIVATTLPNHDLISTFLSMSPPLDPSSQTGKLTPSLQISEVEKLASNALKKAGGNIYRNKKPKITYFIDGITRMWIVTYDSKASVSINDKTREAKISSNL